MNFEEFIEPEELDVQKAVVESLAADKAEQQERIATIEAENISLRHRIAELEGLLKAKEAELAEKALELDSKSASISKIDDLIAANSESTLSNKVALLDRSMELEDHFSGETRDHVIEVLREARDAAEKEGRLRRAQILEAVLVDNEPEGTLAQRREEIEKLFADNQNILSGPVINSLDNIGISYKCGEEYLLPAEIIKRNF